MAINADDGRRYLYELYTNDYSRLRNAACVYLASQSQFVFGLENIRTCQTVAYNFQTHRLYRTMEVVEFNEEIEGMWKRDHLIYIIDSFVNTVFPENRTKKEAIRLWLYSKVRVRGNPDDYIARGRHETGGKVFRFQCKIRNRMFLSSVEKREKRGARVARLDAEIPTSDLIGKNWIQYFVELIRKMLSWIKQMFKGIYTNKLKFWCLTALNTKT